jgi:hypothetical protein
MGLDTKTYWLTDWPSVVMWLWLDFDFDLRRIQVVSVVEVSGVENSSRDETEESRFGNSACRNMSLELNRV